MVINQISNVLKFSKIDIDEEEQTHDKKIHKLFRSKRLENSKDEVNYSIVELINKPLLSNNNHVFLVREDNWEKCQSINNWGSRYLSRFEFLVMIATFRN